MRLGGPITEDFSSPEEWVDLVKKKGYRAAYCPVGLDAEEAIINSYAAAAAANDIVIAEVGAWSNPLSNNKKEKEEALDKCKKALILAEKIGARCCVNIAGSRSNKWDGPDKDNLSKKTFQKIVEMVQQIIDEVKPEKTYYTLETMPWIFPHSVESYQRLIDEIDRKQFAVHFDAVNLVCSPELYFNNGSLIKNFVEVLGPFIKSCHLKDVILHDNLTVHIDEARPGTGELDYQVMLEELNRLESDLPVMLEHLPSEDEYRKAKSYVIDVASKANINLQRTNL